MPFAIFSQYYWHNLAFFPLKFVTLRKFFQQGLTKIRQIRKGLTRKKEIVQVILKQKIGYIRDSKETQSLGTKKECLAISRLLRQRLKIKARGHDYSEEAQAMASKSDRSWSLGGEAVIAGDATKVRELASLFSHPLVSH